LPSEAVSACPSRDWGDGGFKAHLNGTIIRLRLLDGSAGFPTCRNADFQSAGSALRKQGEYGDPRYSQLEVGATVVSARAPPLSTARSFFDLSGDTVSLALRRRA
jgi:hypothetical protein